MDIQLNRFSKNIFHELKALTIHEATFGCPSIRRTVLDIHNFFLSSSFVLKKGPENGQISSWLPIVHFLVFRKIGNLWFQRLESFVQVNP